MGRATELIDFINNDKANDYKYSHLTITAQIVRLKEKLKKKKVKK